MMDRSYHSAEKASEDTRIPVLAAVPWARQIEALTHQTYARFVPSPEPPMALASTQRNVQTPASLQSSDPAAGQTRFEATYQDLAANLLLLRAKSAVQVVAIASCLAGEGKTTVATHLALASVRAGRRVLLVDCDVRRPQIGPLLSLRPPAPNHRAFTASEWVPETHPLLDAGHLDLLQFSDQDALAATGLIASSKFELFLKKWRNDYDLIILDTPASLNAAEAKLVSQYADGLLLVLRIGQTNRDLVNDAVRNFRTTSQTPILGLVANCIP